MGYSELAKLIVPHAVENVYSLFYMYLVVTRIIMATNISFHPGGST
jgi:hypothetical protein